MSHEFPLNFNPSNPFCHGKSAKVASDLENKMSKVEEFKVFFKRTVKNVVQLNNEFSCVAINNFRTMLLEITFGLSNDL